MATALITGVGGQDGSYLAERLLADGVWFADAAGVFAPDPQERARVRAVADELLEG